MISVDPNDEIIPFLSSMAVGITKAAFLSNKRRNRSRFKSLRLRKIFGFDENGILEKKSPIFRYNQLILRICNRKIRF